MVPLILDTDIGTDVDDAVALVFCALDPRIDLRAVTVVNGDVELRARIAVTSQVWCKSSTGRSS